LYLLLPSPHKVQAAETIQGLYQMFIAKDCTMVQQRCLPLNYFDFLFSIPCFPAHALLHSVISTLSSPDPAN
jgi:hypothetical protein